MERLSQAFGLGEASLRSLLDNLPVAIGILEGVRPDGTIPMAAPVIYYNRTWVKLFGFGTDAVKTGEDATRRLYPDPVLREEMIRRRQEANARRQADGGSELMEARAMGADGRWLDVLTGTTVIGTRMVVTMLDITAQRRAESALGESLRLAVHRGGSARRLVLRPSVLAVVAEGKHTRVLVGAESLPDRRSITEWEKLLRSDGFSRIDRSTLLHPGRLSGLTLFGRGAKVALLGSPLSVELGRAGRERVQSLLGQASA